MKTVKDLREFFIRQMDRILDLQYLSQNSSYWHLTAGTRNPFKTNLTLLEKVDLQETWELIPIQLRFDLEIYYNFAHNNITYDELKRRVNKPLDFFWVCVNYGCYLFYKNYESKEMKDDFSGFKKSK